MKADVASFTLPTLQIKPLKLKQSVFIYITLLNLNLDLSLTEFGDECQGPNDHPIFIIPPTDHTRLRSITPTENHIEISHLS